MDHLHQVGLGRHDGVDVLVGHRRFVDDAGVLAALHPLRRLAVIGQGEGLAGLRARHGPPGAVGAGAEAVCRALAADDEGARAHRAGNDPQLALAGRDRALPGQPDIGAEMVFLLHVIVVAVHRGLVGLEVRMRQRPEHGDIRLVGQQLGGTVGRAVVDDQEGRPADLAIVREEVGQDVGLVVGQRDHRDRLRIVPVGAEDLQSCHAGSLRAVALILVTGP